MVMRWLLAGLMVLVGSAHFMFTRYFVAIMPPYLPWHEELVYLSGAIEIGLGVLLLPERTRSLAAWSLMALYVAVFPANLQMALAPVSFDGVSVPPLLAWLRLPLQLVLLYWAYQYTARARARAAT